jgi:hypothetical protein
MSRVVVVATRGAAAAAAAAGVDGGAGAATAAQGLTLVHFSAQRINFVWDKLGSFSPKRLRLSRKVGASVSPCRYRRRCWLGGATG